MAGMETPGDSTPGAPEQINHPIKEYRNDVETQSSTPAGQDKDDWREAPPRNFAPGELTSGEEARRKELLDAAINHHQMGLRTIPLHWVTSGGACSCKAGASCPSAGKHPVELKWEKVSGNPDADTRWWRDLVPGEAVPPDWEPQANIGIPTGTPSDVFVIDIDPRNGGDVKFQQLVDEHPDQPIPPTWVVKTGSGGRHYYFRMPDFRIGGCVNPWGEGIDVKGTGGQVVAPPSISGSGSYADFEKPLDSPTGDGSPVIATAPAWILEGIQEQKKLQRGEQSRLSPAVAPNGVMRAYGQAAVRAQAFTLANAPRGERNKTLNNCALALGHLGPDGIVAEQDAWAALSEAASACGLGREETARTFQSGWRSGYAEPFHPDWKAQDVTWTPRSWDEFGLGDRMVERFADKLRWMPAGKGGSWSLYLAGVWKQAPADTGEQLARAMIDNLEEDEALHYSDEGSDDEDGDKESPRQRFRKWVKMQRCGRGVSAAAGMARLNDLMRINADRCDASPLIINLRNGTWDAAQGKLLAHDPDDLLTMQAGVSYDPDATCPRWDAFLERVQPDPEVRAYLYRSWGYAMTGETGEQVMTIHHGDGANGKSVAHRVLCRILGDYAQVVPVETLTATKLTGKASTDVARMDGKRYLCASEPKEGTKFDEQIIKQLTGGESVAARFLYRDFFEFKPVGKIHFSGNHLQHVNDDPATWRRMHLVPWDVVIPAAEQDKKLADRLYHDEAAGILNRLLAGLDDWMKQGLNAPETIRRRTEEYRRSEDIVQRWLDENIDIDLDRVSAGEGRPVVNSFLQYLHGDFVYWCGQKNLPAGMSDRTLANKLRKKEFVSEVHRNLTYFSQLRVRINPPG